MKKHLLTLTALSVFAFGAGAQTLDQTHTGTGNSNTPINSLTFATQTFTAGMTGQFSRVDLDYSSTGCTMITIGIFDPASTQIGTVNVTLPNPTTPRGLYQHNIVPAPTITAGLVYTIAMYSSCNSGTINWFKSSSNTYPNGISAVNAVQDANSDFYFRTWVGPLSGIASPSPGARPVIAPNPSSGNFSIDFSSVSLGNNAKAEVMDVIGNTILSQNVSGKSRINMDLGNTAKGIYFVKISDGNISYVNKITVQ